MTTPAHRLPIHRECHHGHHGHHVTDDCQQALETLTDVWAALNRAGCHSPLATPAELIDQLAGDRDQARAALAHVQELIATLDDAVERIDRARARYATRPGSPAGSVQGAEPPAESHTQSPVDPGAGDLIGGTVPTAHSGPEDPETGLRTGGFVPDAERVVVGQDNGGCVIAPDAAPSRRRADQ